MKKKLLARLLGATGLRPLLSRVAGWSGVLCLNYHRIGEAGRSAYDHGLWSATAEAFDDQVGWLKSCFDVIRPEDLPTALAGRKGRYVLITFDDGYRDNYTAAFPVLKRHAVPATFFVSTGFIDAPRLPWWDEIAWMVRTSRKAAVELPAWLPAPVPFDEPDRGRAMYAVLCTYKSLSPASAEEFLRAVGDAAGTGRHPGAGAADLWMTWDMLREMRAAGMSVGGHTVNHPILIRMSREEQLPEIDGCGRRLADELGGPMRSFSYPNGDFNEDTRACLREVGVRFAFGYRGGFRTFDDWDDLDVRRMAVESHITLDWFKAMVSLPRTFAA